MLDVTQAKSPHVVDVRALRFEMWPSTQVVFFVQMCANDVQTIQDASKNADQESSRTHNELFAFC